MISHLETKKVLLSSLTKDPRNARAHDEKNLKAIKNSLTKFGQVEPLVVQKSSGKIIGGNGRHAAMESLGWKDCDIVELDIDDEQATALGIVLNRSGELASWDYSILGDVLSELDGLNWDLDGLGFDSNDTDKLINGPSFEPGSEDDQGKLDEKKKVTCPECNHVFTP